MNATQRPAAASATPLAIARRQYGFTSSGTSSRTSLPSGPSRNSSASGTCLTTTATEIERVME